LDELHGFASQEAVLAPQRYSRRWPFVVSIVVLCLVAAGLGAGFAYSTNSAQEWRTSANKSAQDLAAMTTQRDGLKVQAGDLQTKLSDMTTQFNTATDRIRSLSNEKAQIGDQAASLATLVVMSQQVTKEMDLCISDQQKFMSYLANYRPSDYASAMNSARQADTDCNRARADSSALSRTLGG
jgi:septal ring factor EnvC (AmiA/AmiB activator)